MRTAACIRVLVVTVLAFVLAPACTVSTASSPHRDAGSADAPLDAPADVACQNMPMPLTCTGKRVTDYVCLARGCCESAQAACAGPPRSCIMDWPADPMAFCATSAGKYSVTMGVADPCAGYHAVLINGIDGGANYYYSLSTGKLVAVVAHDSNRPSALCQGGPADFIEPNCDFTYFYCSDAGDASSDAPAGPDASAGGADAAP